MTFILGGMEIAKIWTNEIFLNWQHVDLGANNMLESGVSAICDALTSRTESGKLFLKNIKI